MKISFVIPSRNNARYFKWAYDSIRKNQGKHDVYICAADDASTDGTAELFQELAASDPKFKWIQNPGPTRLGHTILYDQIVKELVETQVAIIWHADMYLCPGALDQVEHHMHPKTIVSLTRIEPPLHPQGPEKIIIKGQVAALEPEQFDEAAFLDVLAEINKEYEHKEPTGGVFAPWAFFVSDFLEIGGHDPLFAPQSKEDSDIFNRFKLNGVTFVQTWKGFVYHMTCRGSRRNTLAGAPDVYTNNPEWEVQNIRSTRNFIRKWGHFVRHDELLVPLIPNKYDIGFILEDATYELIQFLEPYVNKLYCTNQYGLRTDVDAYMSNEQIGTLYDLFSRVQLVTREEAAALWDNPTHDVMLRISSKAFNATPNDYILIMQQLPDILAESGQVGYMEYNLMQFKITKLEGYQNENIHNPGFKLRT